MVKDAIQLMGPFSAANLFKKRADLVKEMKPLLRELTGIHQDILRESFEMLAIGDKNQALVIAERKMTTYMEEFMEATLEKQSAELPGFVSSVVKKVAWDIIQSETDRVMDGDTSSSGGVMVAKKILHGIVKIVAIVFPEVVSTVITNVPKNLEKAKRRFKKLMTVLGTQLSAILSKGPLGWNEFTGAKATKAIVAAAVPIKKLFYICKLGGEPPDVDHPDANGLEIDELYAENMATSLIGLGESNTEVVVAKSKSETDDADDGDDDDGDDANGSDAKKPAPVKTPATKPGAKPAPKPGAKPAPKPAATDEKAQKYDKLKKDAAAKRKKTKPPKNFSTRMHILVNGLPSDIMAMFTEVVRQLEADNVDGAKATMDKEMKAWATGRIEAVVERMTKYLPAYAQGPVQTAFTNILKAEAAQIAQQEEYMSDEGYEFGESNTPAFSLSNLLMENGIMLVGGSLPGVIENMVHHLPRSLKHAKIPVRKALTTATKKIMNTISAGSSTWSTPNFGIIVEAVINAAKEIDDEAKIVKKKLKAFKEIKKAVYGMKPKAFVRMARDSLESLLADDLEGAVMTLDHQIIQYGVGNVYKVISEFAGRLPKFAAKPVEKAFSNIVKKQASLMGVTSDKELGEAMQTGGYVGITVLLIGEFIHVMKAVAPPLIQELLDQVPERLETAKVPVKAALTNMANDVLDTMGQGASMWGEKGANEVALAILRHVQFLVKSLKKVAPASETVVRAELGQPTPKRAPAEFIPATGGMLLPHGVTVSEGTPQMLGETDDRHELGESAEIGTGDSPLQTIMEPMLQELPSDFRKMMQMVFTKLLLKESAKASEELKKGIAEYGETKVENTVKAMTDKMPLFMRGMTNRAIMSVVKKQFAELSGEASGFNPTVALKDASIEFLRQLLPECIKRMGTNLAFGKAQGVLTKSLQRATKSIIQNLQTGGWSPDSRTKIVDIVIKSSKSLIADVTVSMRDDSETQSAMAELLLD
jgi:hypothetical protein